MRPFDNFSDILRIILSSRHAACAKRDFPWSHVESQIRPRGIVEILTSREAIHQTRLARASSSNIVHVTMFYATKR